MITAITLLVALSMVAVAGLAVSQPPPQQGPQTASEVELRLEMQHMWETHVHDLHNLIAAEINDLPETPVILEKSLMDVDKMAFSLQPFYGQEAAANLDRLLRLHETTAYNYVKAAEEGNQEGMRTALADSAAVVDQIAQCLSSLNPNWPYEAVKTLFQTHVNDLVNITDLKLAANFAGELDAVDTAVQHARLTADVITDGLVAQFPERFGK
jgi:hypothetical protein